MLKMPKKPATGRRQPPKGQLKKSEDVLSYILDLINMAPDLAYLAGPPGTGKTLTTVIMALEWLRKHETVDILSGYIGSLAAAHLIKQQLQETARLILGEQAASRVHLHDNLDQDGAVDRLVATLTARPTYDVSLIADEAEGFGKQLDALFRALVNNKKHVRLWAVAEARFIKTGRVPDYTTPTAPLPADGPPVIIVSHQGPGHEETYILHCQGDNPSSSSTTALQYRDVFVLSSFYTFHDDDTDDAGHVTRRASGVVRGLRQAGVPVRVVGVGDNMGVDDDTDDY
nr:hypothetical protein BaRGS_029873 [Batillaria attramentaria]